MGMMGTWHPIQPLEHVVVQMLPEALWTVFLAATLAAAPAAAPAPALAGVFRKAVGRGRPHGPDGQLRRPATLGPASWPDDRLATEMTGRVCCHAG